MKRIIVAAVVVLAGLPAAAPAATHRWQLTAEVTGGYANAVTATTRCAASFREQVRGVRIRLTSRRPLRYDPVARVLTGVLRYRVLGGRWTVDGSYAPVVAQPDGTLDCGAQPAPVTCSARVVADDGHRVRLRGTARLAVDDGTPRAVVSRLDGPRLTEQYADAGAPPADWPSACRVATDDERVPVTPLFGLASTGLADRALAARIRIPAAKLVGHRRFVVRVPASRPTGCPAQGFDPCTEQGGFATRATFTPA
jgi:hypothetical protein